MYYQLFLQTLSQLSSRGTASLTFENGIIYIQSLHGNTKWRISTPLFIGEGRIPSPVRSYISSRGSFHWQKTGAYLQLEDSTKTLLLIDELEIQKDKYHLFKKTVQDFMGLAQEWKEIFNRLSLN